MALNELKAITVSKFWASKGSSGDQQWPLESHTTASLSNRQLVKTWTMFFVLSHYLDHVVQWKEACFVKLIEMLQSPGLQEMKKWLPCWNGKIMITFLTFVCAFCSERLQAQSNCFIILLQCPWFQWFVKLIKMLQSPGLQEMKK